MILQLQYKILDASKKSPIEAEPADISTSSPPGWELRGIQANAMEGLVRIQGLGVEAKKGVLPQIHGIVEMKASDMQGGFR